MAHSIANQSLAAARRSRFEFLCQDSFPTKRPTDKQNQPMNKIKCLEPLLSTFEAVFPSRRQAATTLLLLSSREERWLSPQVDFDGPSGSQNWPFEPPSNAPAMAAPDGQVPPALDARQAEVEARFSDSLAEPMPIRVAIVEDDR